MTAPTSPIPSRRPAAAAEVAGRDAADGTPRTGPTASQPADPEPPDVDTPVADRALGWVLLVGGVVGTVTAVVLLLEKIALASDPNYIPSCSIDPVLSCGSIMRTAQAAAFGFPNPIIGVAAYPMVVVAGALVVGRVALPRWFWLGLQFGATVGVAFVHWLIVQSLAVIGALCPYCMVAWVVTIAIFWFVTAHNLAAGHLEFGAAGRFLARHRGVVLGLWYLAVGVAVIATFPDYWAATVGL